MFRLVPGICDIVPLHQFNPAQQQGSRPKLIRFGRRGGGD
jgi:hypothetical protein